MVAFIFLGSSELQPWARKSNTNSASYDNPLSSKFITLLDVNISSLLEENDETAAKITNGA